MEKRLPIAIFLSFLVLMAWTIFSPKQDPEKLDPQSGGQGGVAQAAIEENQRLEGFAKAPSTGELLVANAEEEIPLRMGRPGEAGSYDMLFSNRGARLLSLRIGDYFSKLDLENGATQDTSTWVQLLSSVSSEKSATGSLRLVASASAKTLLTEPLEDALWQHRLLEDGGIEFSYAPGTGLVFRKRLVRGAKDYSLHFTFEVENLSAAGASGLKQFTFTPADVVPPVGNERFYVEPQTIAAWADRDGVIEVEVKERKHGSGDVTGSLAKPAESTLSFAGVHNKFFSFLVTPTTPDDARRVLGASWRRVHDNEWPALNPEEDAGEAWRFVVCDLALQVSIPEVGGTSSMQFEVYAGPKQRQTLENVNPAFASMLDEDVGMFSSVANVITAILAFYQGLVGNWGFAIILMTFTVRALLFPLNRRAQTAMARFAKKMKRVQPMLDANKEQNADDPKKQREEQAKIMQREGAFPPLGGCAPMFLQIPVFIGLFQALRVHFDLRHEPFVLWMKDLSLPDRLAHINLDTHLPFIGTIEYLNILPLIMIVLWIGQHKVMPQPESTDPKQQQTKKIMMAMQIFFAFLFYNYASGLALYMITSSGLAIFESLVIKRVWPIDDSESEKKKPGRFMQKMASLQKEQQRRLDLQQKNRGAGGGKPAVGGKGKPSSGAKKGGGKKAPKGR